jgi:D-3-phosphoglycerate dehydrogenase
LAMILSCARRLHQLDRASHRDGTWDVTVTAPGRRRLSQQTLGIVGCGRIGQSLGCKAAGLGMQVLGCDPLLAAPPDGFPGPLVPLADLLAESDYVSLHAPLTPDTRALIGAAELALMKPGAFLVNNARGGLVDETALLRALESGRLGGAALDVRVAEPPPANDALMARDDVLVTPHAAAFTVDAVADLRAMVVGYLEEALRA